LAVQRPRNCRWITSVVGIDETASAIQPETVDSSRRQLEQQQQLNQERFRAERLVLHRAKRPGRSVAVRMRCAGFPRAVIRASETYLIASMQPVHGYQYEGSHCNDALDGDPHS
jgi:hypothetical protein